MTSESEPDWRSVIPGNVLVAEADTFGFPSDQIGPGLAVGPNPIFSLVQNGVPEGGATAALMAIAMGTLLAVKRLVRA